MAHVRGMTQLNHPAVFFLWLAWLISHNLLLYGDYSSVLLLLIGVKVRRSSLVLRLQHFCYPRSPTLVYTVVNPSRVTAVVPASTR